MCMQDSENKILRILFVLVWIIALIHVAAEYYAWYWTFRWFDIPMHILGGIWLGLATLWLCNQARYAWCKFLCIVNRTFLTAIVGGVCVGLVWEIYEFCIWQYTGFAHSQDYALDTVLDLVNVVVGAVIGAWAYQRLTREKK